MAEVWLECGFCGTKEAFGPTFSCCPHCRAGGRLEPLEVRYRAFCPQWPALDRAAGLWRWRAWLPPVASITLGEGDTPLTPLLLSKPGPRLLLKNETINPTWSWKDRPNAVTVAAARHFGFAKIAAISTGNHGGAQAAYAARAGLCSTIFCHPDAPDLQRALMRLFQADVVAGYDAEAETALGRLLEEGDVFPGTTLSARAGYSNPFGIEGFKTIAFELVDQLGGAVPDRVYIPVGSGDGIYGIWKGFRELHQAGLIPRLPRIMACQAEGADSIVQALKRGSDMITPITRTATSALSIAELCTGTHALRALIECGGSVASVPDSDAQAAAETAAQQGIALELASCVALACALSHYSKVDKSEVWVSIGSGAAVKWPGMPPLNGRQ